MKIFGFLTGPLSALFLFATADAQVTLDIARITCKQFLIGDVIPTRSLTLWLSGYYHGKRDVTVISPVSLIDPVTLDPNVEKVKDYCVAHQGEMAMKAVEVVLGAGK
jgi:acid stress chaperone HdeB